MGVITLGTKLGSQFWTLPAVNLHQQQSLENGVPTLGYVWCKPALSITNTECTSVICGDRVMRKKAWLAGGKCREPLKTVKPTIIDLGGTTQLIKTRYNSTANL